MNTETERRNWGIADKLIMTVLVGTALLGLAKTGFDRYREEHSKLTRSVMCSGADGGCVYITRNHPAWKDFLEDETRIARR